VTQYTSSRAWSILVSRRGNVVVNLRGGFGLITLIVLIILSVLIVLIILRSIVTILMRGISFLIVSTVRVMI